MPKILTWVDAVKEGEIKAQNEILEKIVQLREVWNSNDTLDSYYRMALREIESFINKKQNKYGTSILSKTRKEGKKAVSRTS